jgi:hypothetical protein
MQPKRWSNGRFSMYSTTKWSILCWCGGAGGTGGGGGGGGGAGWSVYEW